MENDNPKISVIMPSLNVEDFIGQCIESVINQTFKDLEIICVDAGSTDGTLEILDKYSKKDSRIKIIHSDKKSYGYQMNLGIDAAKGEYIGIVETDDFIDEKMYETLHGLTNDSTTDISKVNFYHYYGESDFKADKTKKNLPDDPFTVFDFPQILKGHPSIWAAIYKKEFLKRNGIEFMEVLGGGWVDNPFLFKTMLSAQNMTYKDEAFYYYRELNPESSTNDMDDLTLPMRRMLDLFDVLDDYQCRDEKILKEFYIRIFWHIDDVLKRDNYTSQEKEVVEFTHEVVKRMDENIVKSDFGFDDQKLYYKYLSPLRLKQLNGDASDFTLEEIADINKENNFLLEYGYKMDKDNEKLRKKNRKLKKSIKN